MKNKEAIRGIIPPTVTPLKKEEQLDRNAVGKLIDYCIRKGVSGIFCNGTSGEAMRLTDRVWAQNTEATLECAAKRVPVANAAIRRHLRCAISIKRRLLPTKAPDASMQNSKAPVRVSMRISRCCRFSAKSKWA